MTGFSPSSPPERPAFQRALLRWYDRHKRDLPWRRNPTPYRVLISEFMLQQTRVETVIPYFRRFLKLFPSLRALARAPISRVLKAWAGLGYYARARNLHAVARIVCRELGGRIPRTREGLGRLPGLGPYTAGAVASIAFHQPVAALDGNVKRILERLFRGHGDFSRATGGKKSEEFLAGWIPPGRASEFNQALMDLGALICTPSSPRCSACPVFRFCASKGEIRGKKGAGRKSREEIWAVALVEKEGKFLLHRKEGRGLLAGLWQFPSVVVDRNGEKTEKCGDARRLLERYLREAFGLKTRMKIPLAEQEHSFTHIHVHLKPHLGCLARPGISFPRSRSVRWVRPSDFYRYPISTAMRKIAAQIPGAGPV